MKNTLLTPGPTNVPAEVAAALTCLDHSHRDEVSMAVLARLRRRAAALLGGDAGTTALVLACSGTGANEALINTVAGRLLVLDAGRYSRRLRDIAARCQVPVETLEFDAWSGIDPAQVDALLARRPDLTDVFLVHLETTTGALAPLAELGAIVHRHRRRLFVDAVSSAFGHPLEVAGHHLTACTITPNKCLEGPPGIAMIVADAAWLATLRGRARSYYFDLYAQHQQLSTHHAPSFTVSPAIMAATEVALARAEAEGLAARARRYRQLRDQLRASLTAHGIRVRVPARDSNIITVFELAAGVAPERLVNHMAEVGFIVQSHHELTSEGLFGVATLGDLASSEVARFADELGKLLDGSAGGLGGAGGLSGGPL